MDRRFFLTGMLGLAGAATLAGLAGPRHALAGVPNGKGILDELDAPDPDVAGETDVEAEPVHHRPWHRRRRRRRRVWRRICRREWHRGRWRRRCRRRRVWVWDWYWT